MHPRRRAVSNDGTSSIFRTPRAIVMLMTHRPGSRRSEPEEAGNNELRIRWSPRRKRHDGGWRTIPDPTNQNRRDPTSLGCRGGQTWSHIVERRSSQKYQNMNWHHPLHWAMQPKLTKHNIEKRAPRLGFGRSSRQPSLIWISIAETTIKRGYITPHHWWCHLLANVNWKPRPNPSKS